MADDSIFCGNCGTEFQESITETVSEPLQVFQEPRFGLKMQYPVGWNKEVRRDKISFYPYRISEIAKRTAIYQQASINSAPTTRDYMTFFRESHD
jgi:hypothetical protein